MENAVTALLSSVTALKTLRTYEPSNFGDHAINLPALTLKLAPFKTFPESLDMGTVEWTWDMVIWLDLADPDEAQRTGKQILGEVLDIFKANPTLDNAVVSARIVAGDGFVPMKTLSETALTLPTTLAIERHEY